MLLAAASRTGKLKRKRVSFDVTATDIYACAATARMVRWTELPDQGGCVDVPSPLPEWWLRRSQADLRRAQGHARRLAGQVADATTCAIPAVESPGEVAKPAETLAAAPIRTKAALSRSWVLDNGSAHHVAAKADLAVA